jgi:hypothetical protein
MLYRYRASIASIWQHCFYTIFNINCSIKGHKVNYQTISFRNYYSASWHTNHASTITHLELLYIRTLVCILVVLCLYFGALSSVTCCYRCVIFVLTYVLLVHRFELINIFSVSKKNIISFTRTSALISQADNHEGNLIEKVITSGRTRRSISNMISSNTQPSPLFL